jgi:hypothetical protein
MRRVSLGLGGSTARPAPCSRLPAHSHGPQALQRSSDCGVRVLACEKSNDGAGEEIAVVIEFFL